MKRRNFWKPDVPPIPNNHVRMSICYAVVEFSSLHILRQRNTNIQSMISEQRITLGSHRLKRFYELKVKCPQQLFVTH